MATMVTKVENVEAQVSAGDGGAFTVRLYNTGIGGDTETKVDFGSLQQFDKVVADIREFLVAQLAKGD